jgi:putative ABC transport system substrate-binding protein
MATIRKKIIKAAADNSLPAIYANRMYVKDGGLISRGTYTPNLYLKAGDYAKQILDGTTTPTPVIDITQTGKDPNHPAVFETAINLKTAKALGPDILANAEAIPADFVIPLGP